MGRTCYVVGRTRPHKILVVRVGLYLILDKDSDNLRHFSVSVDVPCVVRYLTVESLRSGRGSCLYKGLFISTRMVHGLIEILRLVKGVFGEHLNPARYRMICFICLT